jgi:hypothetical protein
LAVEEKYLVDTGGGRMTVGMLLLGLNGFRRGMTTPSSQLPIMYIM